MDEQLRRVERRALAGDAAAERLWRRLCGRIGLYFRDHQPDEILTEWEEIQQDYDDLWWHGSTPHKCGLWNRSCFRHRDEDFKTSVFKAHLDWGHKGWDTKNSKRKTLRTHRDAKKKARNYRLPEERKTRGQETPRERRRKKRFGGREHRYGRAWVENQRTGRWRIVYKFGVPDLDE